MATGASNAGSNAGEKVKGFFETAHGVGESLRGGALDFVDSAVGSGKRHNSSQRGAQEAEEGIARMEHGKAGANATGPVPEPGTTADNSTRPSNAGNEKPHAGLGSVTNGAGYGTGTRSAATDAKTAGASTGNTL